MAREAEAVRTANRLEELRLQQEAAVDSLSVDPVTGEKCTALELVARNHARAMAAIQAKAAEPVHLSDEEALALHQRKTELTDRYNRARDASLALTLASEKF